MCMVVTSQNFDQQNKGYWIIENIFCHRKLIKITHLVFSNNQCIFIVLAHEFTFAFSCHGEMHGKAPIGHLIGHPPIQLSHELINISSCHMKKCICLFMSWRNAWESPIDHPICPFIVNIFVCILTSQFLTLS
jgi:hypothetical protein